jgi:hypothetical protein
MVPETVHDGGEVGLVTLDDVSEQAFSVTVPVYLVLLVAPVMLEVVEPPGETAVGVVAVSANVEAVTVTVIESVAAP